MSENETEIVEEDLDSAGHASGVEREEDEGEGVEILSPFDPTDIDIKTKNPSVDSLMKRLDHSEIDMNPDFQRKGGIWSKLRKSRLIESFLLNIPLPVFYVASDADGNWIVVDGLQRLTALNQFIREEAFALEQMEFLHQFNGYRFNDLPRAMKRRIIESEPVFHIIQPGSPKAVTRTIFKRINTSGMPLSAQEIRNALYQGSATRFLKELAASNAFLRATSGSIKDDRMADRECVLRYLAFSIRGVGEYRASDLDGFLSDTMEHLNNTDPSVFAAYRVGFELAMDRAFRIFGDRAFRKPRRDSDRKSPVNKALFETWSVALGNLDEGQAEQLIRRRGPLNDAFIDLLESDQEFGAAISATTGNVASVQIRFARVQSLIVSVWEAEE
jgi:hypothetical protein